MGHRYDAPLRWGDLDAQGHLNNGAYLDYLQDARVDFLLRNDLGELLRSGVLVVGHQVEYVASWGYDRAPLTVQLWVDAVGASRFVIGYEVTAPDGTALVHARTVAAPFELAAGRLRRLTPVEQGVLEKHLHPQPPLREVARAGVVDAAYRWPLTVRWSDLDSYGHVNNVRFYDYLQEARLPLMVDAIGWADGEVWALVRQDVDYRRPIDHRTEPYEVATSVTAVGSRSLTLSAMIRDPSSGTAFATARSVVVGTTPFTDDQRESLARWS